MITWWSVSALFVFLGFLLLFISVYERKDNPPNKFWASMRFSALIIGIGFVLIGLGINMGHFLY
jgi:hypothetical protein